MSTALQSSATFPVAPAPARPCRLIPIYTHEQLQALPPKIPSPTAENPFTFPRPKVVTCPRSSIRVVRARQRLVVVDSDLATLYGTTVDEINKTAMRNACCFTRRTCFRLSNDEWHHLKHDAKGATGLAEADRGNWLCAPLVFTGAGVAAVAVILDTFDSLRGYVLTHRLLRRLERTGEWPMSYRRRIKHRNDAEEADTPVTLTEAGGRYLNEQQAIAEGGN